MTQRFYADFNQADGALGAEWDIKVVGFGGVQVLDQAAVNVGTDAAAARQAEAEIDTDEQELRVAFSFAAVSTGDAIYIGVGSDDDAAAPSVGFACRFAVAAGPVYRVEILSDPEDSQVGAPAVIATANVSPKTIGGTMAGVVQDLRLRIRRAPGGYDLLVWFNEADDELPTTSHRFLREHIDPTAFGVAWFRPHSDTAAERVFVGYFDHRAYTSTSGRRVAGWRPATAPTLAMMRANVMLLMERRENAPSWSEPALDRALNMAQTSILNGLGDQAVFLRLSESVDLTQNQVTGLVEMPLRIGRLLSVKDSLERVVEFRTMGMSPNGYTLVWFPFGIQLSALRVTYEPIREPMILPDDLAMVPADYSHVVELRAILTLVSSDGTARDQQAFSGLYTIAYAEMLKSLRAKQRGTKAYYRVGGLEPFTTNLTRSRRY